MILELRSAISFPFFNFRKKVRMKANLSQIEQQPILAFLFKTRLTNIY